MKTRRLYIIHCRSEQPVVELILAMTGGCFREGRSD